MPGAHPVRRLLDATPLLDPGLVWEGTGSEHESTDGTKGKEVKIPLPHPQDRLGGNSCRGPA